MAEVPCDGGGIGRCRAAKLRVLKYALPLVGLFVVIGLWWFRGLPFDGSFYPVILNKYIPCFYQARLEPVDVPTLIVKGSRTILRFRATNKSPQCWRLCSKHDRGIHLGAKVRLVERKAGQEIELRGGFRDVTVGPGEAIVLELEIPSILESGRYQFFVDLVNERVKWFSDMGSEPLTFEIRVVEEKSDSHRGS